MWRIFNFRSVCLHIPFTVARAERYCLQTTPKSLTCQFYSFSRRLNGDNVCSHCYQAFSSFHSIPPRSSSHTLISRFHISFFHSSIVSNDSMARVCLHNCFHSISSLFSLTIAEWVRVCLAWSRAYQPSSDKQLWVVLSRHEHVQWLHLVCMFTQLSFAWFLPVIQSLFF